MTKEKRENKRQFPKIFRFITEQKFLKKVKKHQWRLMLAGLVSSVVLASIIFVSINLYGNYQKKIGLDVKRKKIGWEIKFWEKAIGKYKDYRDGYFQLALLEYQLKDFVKANEYLQKTLSLDPNYKEGRELESVLNKM